MVEGSVTLVEHVNPACVRTFGVSVVCLEKQVVAPAGSKRHVGLVFQGIGEGYLSGACALFPDHGNAAESVSATVVFDGADKM